MFFFFIQQTATPKSYTYRHTLSRHCALPIWIVDRALAQAVVMREMSHAEAHRVGHRVEPREEHQEAYRHQFFEARLAAVDLAGDDLRDHVVARLGHPDRKSTRLNSSH